MWHNLIGWVLRLAFMPRWIGRTKWFKARYCLCGSQHQAQALKRGRRLGGWQYR